MRRGARSLLVFQIYCLTEENEERSTFFARFSDLLIQDEKVLSELDIYALVGANKPLQLVDFRASVKEDDSIDIRFEGVVGSPVACGVCIRRAPKLPDSLLKHERIRCSSCTADIELPMTLMRDMRQRNTAMFEKKIEDLNIKLDRKKEECSLAWMSLTAANDQLTKIRTELDNKLFQTYTLDQRVEKQTAEIKALCSRYEEGKKTWINAISNLENKIKAMKQEHVELSHEAHQCADSIPELNQMICAVQALVAECVDLKTKYLDEQRMRKKLYNEVQEAKGMYGNPRLMARLLFLRMNGMSHLAAELKSDCTFVKKLESIWKRVN